MPKSTPKKNHNHTHFDILSIGDSTIDAFMHINDASVNCTIDANVCQLCLNYADKIISDKLNFLVGGNAANAAVTFARMKLSSAICTSIGSDDIGTRILNSLKADHIATDFVRVDPLFPSNFSVVINFQGERTILAHHEPRKYPFPEFLPPKWIYFTAMGENYAPFYKEFVSYLHHHRVPMSFNPGTWQLRAGLKGLREILRHTTILFVNKEEAEKILGLGRTPMVTLLLGLKKTGPSHIVITDGDQGSYAYDGHHMWFLPAYPTKVVEKTGAGDAYASAYTVAVLRGLPMVEAMRFGGINAASVITKIGPQDGILKLNQILHRTSKEKNYKPHPFRQ